MERHFKRKKCYKLLCFLVIFALLFEVPMPLVASTLNDMRYAEISTEGGIDNESVFVEESDRFADSLKTEDDSSNDFVSNNTESLSILDATDELLSFEDILENDFLNTEVSEDGISNEGRYINSEREIITEIPELRDPDTKYFLNSDGTRTASIYNHDVHYLTDTGVYEDIDNSLISTKTKAGKDVITNEENSTDFYFAQNADEGNMVSVRTDGFDLKWRLDSSEHKKIKKSKAKIKLNPSAKELVSTSKDFDDVKDTVSKAEYQNILDDVDIEYVLLGTKIKENILINNADAISDFSFVLTSETLYAKKQGKEIIFCDKDGSTVYTMSEAIMYDDNGAESTDIKVKLKVISETEDLHQYQLMISPSKKWLQDENRAYPVVLDPTITTTQSATSIEDAHVNSDSPNTNKKTSSSLVLGTNSSGHSRAYIKFALPKEITKSDRIVSAELGLCPDVNNSYSLFYGSQISSAPTFYAFAPSESWNSGTITWNNQPAYDTFRTLDYHEVKIENKVASTKWATYDITSIVDDWYNGTVNNGIMIKGTESTAYSKRAYYCSSDHTDTPYKPMISISYANMIGLEDYWTYHAQEAGLAGMGYVNDFTGSLTTCFGDFTKECETLPITINHVYSSDYAGTTADSLNVGDGFRLNLQEQLKYLTINGTNLYRYIDGDGTQHYFQKNSEGKWVDDSGLDLTLTIGSTWVIRDKHDNTKTFDSSTGFLKEIKDNEGNKLTFTYSGTTLTSVQDDAGYIANFYTQNGKLSSIEVYEKDTSWSTFAYYNYTGNKLTSVTFPGKVLFLLIVLKKVF